MITEKKTITNTLRLYNQDVEEIIKAAEAQHAERPYLRIGQCLYNELYTKNQELATLVCTTSADPFYNDNNINRFLMAITKI